MRGFVFFDLGVIAARDVGISVQAGDANCHHPVVSYEAGESPAYIVTAP